MRGEKRGEERRCIEMDMRTHIKRKNKNTYKKVGWQIYRESIRIAHGSTHL